MGEQIAELTRAMGSQILWVKNGEEKVERCLLKVVGDLENARRIARIFSCELRQESNLAAPIVFIIGEKLADGLPR